MKQAILFPGQPYILYADDDTDDRAFAVEMMRKLNPAIRVFGCENGLEVVQFLESLDKGVLLPCCIVLDVNMPVWDGFRALRVIKKQPMYTLVPVYMVTSFPSSKDASLATSEGAAEYLPKPYNQKDLQMMCEELASHADDPKQYKEFRSADKVQ